MKLIMAVKTAYHFCVRSPLRLHRIIYWLTLALIIFDQFFFTVSAIMAAPSAAFIITRRTETKVNNTDSHPVTLIVTANQNFTGTIEDSVPASFDISEPKSSLKYTEIKTTDSGKKIWWELTLKKGQSATLGYYYKSSSPGSYSLGPLRFYNRQNTKIYQENQKNILQVTSPPVSSRPSPRPDTITLAPPSLSVPSSSTSIINLLRALNPFRKRSPSSVSPTPSPAPVQSSPPATPTWNFPFPPPDTTPQLPLFVLDRDAPPVVIPGHRYTVTLRLTVNQDFTGTLEDTLPKSFEVFFPQDSSPAQITPKDNVQKLWWDVSLKKGETLIQKYEFAFPVAAFPAYPLGAAKLYSTQNRKVFEEASRHDLIVHDVPILPSLSPSKSSTPTLPSPDGTVATSSAAASQAPVSTPVREPTSIFDRLKAKIPGYRKVELKNKKDHLKAEDEISLETRGYQLGELTVTLENTIGRKIPAEVVVEGNSLKIRSKNKFRPGKYRLKVTDSGQKTVYEQDFTWGVLAINTNKSIYLPNETASLAFAVLDDNGNMVCDAQLKLTITGSDNQSATLSTADGTIRVNPECQFHEYTKKPDYEANYTVGQPGTYRLDLEAVTSNGTYRIGDTFEVRPQVDFDVERLTATRIYPFDTTYPVTFKIKANRDFDGVIEELVPSDFAIYPLQDSGILGFQSTVAQTGAHLLRFPVNLKAGDTLTLGYSFDAPDISPQFYLLGPLEFKSSSGDSVFKESRRWQLAIDAEVTIDDTVSTTINAHQKSGKHIVCTNDTDCYVFYLDATFSNGVVVARSFNGGVGWTAPVSVGITGSWHGLSVWYDRWTPGDTTGNYIHLAILQNTHRIIYSRYDTINNTFSPPADASGATEGSINATNDIAITKATDGDIYVGTVDASAPASGANFIEKCSSSSNCTLSVNWTAAGSNPWDGTDNSGGCSDSDTHDANYSITLQPLSGGDIMLVSHDVTENHVEYKIYDVSNNTWTPDFCDLDTSAIGGSTNFHTLSGTVSVTTNNVYISYVSNSQIQDVSETRAWQYNGSSWTQLPDPWPDTTDSASMLIDSSIAIDNNTQDLYVVYARSPNTGANHVLYSHYDQDTGSWSIDNLISNGTSGNHRGVSVNASSDERLYAIWYDPAPDDIYGGLVVDLVPPTPTPTPTTPASPSLSGIAYSSDGTTPLGSGKTVRLLVNGSGDYTDDTDSSGNWQIAVNLANSDVITVFLDGESEQANTILLSNGTTHPDLNLIQNTLLLRSDSATLTNTHLVEADNDSPDLFYSLNDDDLYLDPGRNLNIYSQTSYVSSGIFTSQGGSLILDNLSILSADDSGYYYISGDTVIGTGATLTAPASRTILAIGNWTNNGIFVPGTGKTILGSTSPSTTIKTNGSPFNDLEINNGLVAYYKFDEGMGNTTTHDNSGVGTSALLGTSTGPDSSDPTWSTATKDSSYYGSNPGSLSLDEDDFIIFDAPPNYQWDTGSYGTISFWLKPDWDSSDTSATRFLFSVYDSILDSSTDRMYFLYCGSDGLCAGTPGNLYYLVDNDSVLQSQVSVTSAHYSWDSGDWLHFTLTWDDTASTNDLRLYLNGQEPTHSHTNEGDLDISLLSGLDYVFIGDASRSVYGLGFSGIVDDCRIYDRVLSSTEIGQLVTGSHPSINTYILQDDLIVNGDLGIRTGVLDVSSQDYDILLSGNYINVANFTSRSGHIYHQPASGVRYFMSDPALNHVNFGTSGSTATINLNNQRLDINGNLNITSATLASTNTCWAGSSCPIYAAGNWTNSGTFTANTSTVYFDRGSSTQTIAGSTTFHHLNITTSTARTVNFANSSVVGVSSNGSLTLSGAASQLLNLEPVTSGNDWSLQVSPTNTTVSVSYVNVSHSNAGDYKTIDASNGTNINGGNNTNWIFSTNSQPVISDLLLNNGEPINLTENTTVGISWTAIATDPDGHSDLISFSGKIYRSGVDQGPDCTAHNNNCYVGTCNASDCSGNNCTVTCTADLLFHADPTDVGSTFSAENWVSFISATDSEEETGSSVSAGVDLNSLAALDVTGTISYGQLFIGDDTGSTNQIKTVTNTGNRRIDLDISGDNFCPDYPTCTGPTLPVSVQQYHLSPFTYGAGTTLSTVSNRVNANISKPDTSPSTSTQNIYWGIGIPSGITTGTYNAEIDILAYPD